MVARESSNQSNGADHLDDSASSTAAASSPTWQSGYWWRCRHLHVPVIVWIVASVLGGAVIGSALETDRKADRPATTTQGVVQPVGAVACDENYADCVPVSSDVDCADADGDTDAGAEADGPSYMSGPVEVIGDDVYELDPDQNGIACD